ncbi:Diphthamide biosynthesis protein 1 [Armadillidium vulgare]|nr:Diphthamide biosynthesis protein 1 [Armadillidium vulgare]
MNEYVNADEDNSSKQVVQTTNKNKPKIFKPSRKVLRGVPSYIEDDINLKHAMEVLPKNYNFEIPKSIWRIKQAEAKLVTLQFPEGLMIFCGVIADIIEEWTGAQVIILCDVTYGACCVDDYTAKEYESDFMIHYAHSCLVPMDQTNSVTCLYVFVDIQFDSLHFLKTIQKVFKPSIPLALVSIIQFVSSLQRVADELKSLGYTVIVPQCHPLSPGEVLGCTSVPVPKGYTVLGLGDGRFHLESVMISNPDANTYLYNPYSKLLSHESYNHAQMKSIRRREIDKCAIAQNWGVILGTLGRQGSVKVLESIKNQLELRGKSYTIFFMSEIFPDTLAKIEEIDAWIQIACPRLSIDWGASYCKPLLNPYEASVTLKNIEWCDVYPMDYYAYESKGNWTPNHKPPCPCGFTRQTGCKGQRCKSKNS